MRYSEDEINLIMDKFIEMCRNHPEICPHDYICDKCEETSDGKLAKHYRCYWCSNKKVEICKKPKC